MAEIKKIHLPNGNEYDIQDVTSTNIRDGANISRLTNNSGFTTNTGTVTSARVQATSPVVSSQNTAQSTTLNTTISLADAYGDTKNPYGSKTKNYVLASPSGSNGAPSFRALVANDIPSITKSKISDMPTKLSQFTNDIGFIIMNDDTSSLSGSKSLTASTRNNILTVSKPSGATYGIGFVSANVSMSQACNIILHCGGIESGIEVGSRKNEYINTTGQYRLSIVGFVIDNNLTFNITPDQAGTVNSAAITVFWF